MSKTYPEIPSYPLDEMGRYPKAFTDDTNMVECFVCGARWTSLRAYKLDDFNYHKTGDEKLMPPYPHVRWACGGIWRDVGNGVWEGRCGAPNTVQLEFNMEEVT